MTMPGGTPQIDLDVGRGRTWSPNRPAQEAKS